jgi:hypothetical protein
MVILKMENIIKNLSNLYPQFEFKSSIYSESTQRPPSQIYNVLSWLNENPTELEELSDEQWDSIEVNEVNIGKLWDCLIMNSGETSFNGDINFDSSLDKYNGY